MIVADPETADIFLVDFCRLLNKEFSMVNYERLPSASKFFNGKLYVAMRDDLQLAGMSKRTVHGYLRAVRQLADYCQRRPNRITEAQLSFRASSSSIRERASGNGKPSPR
jgi:hypothetical protein